MPTLDKSRTAEEVKIENHIIDLQSECSKLEKTKEDLQTLIDRKTSEYNIYLSQKDVESKKAHADVLGLQEKLMKDKMEFENILKQHKEEKAKLEMQKREFEVQQLKAVSKKENVQQFVTAVKRAVNLLDI